MTHPKGYLIAVGGSEDKGEEEKVKQNKLNFFEEGILRQNWRRKRLFGGPNNFHKKLLSKR